MRTRNLAVIAMTLAIVVAFSAPAAMAAAACPPAGWVGAWAGVPSDASLGTDIGNIFAPSAEKTPGDTKQPVNNASVRAILTPSLGGVGRADPSV